MLPQPGVTGALAGYACCKESCLANDAIDFARLGAAIAAIGTLPVVDEKRRWRVELNDTGVGWQNHRRLLGSPA